MRQAVWISMLLIAWMALLALLAYVPSPTYGTAPLDEAWQGIGKFLQSNLAIAIVSAFAGAFAGAWGAQHIIERAKSKSDIVKEVRNTNAATMVSFSICNTALAIKGQHVKPMLDLYEEHQAILEAAEEAKAKGQDSPVNITFDFRIFPAPVAPLDSLKRLVYHDITAHGRALALVSVLEQTLAALSSALEARNALIAKFSEGVIKESLIPAYYFGTPLPEGNTNRQYPDHLEAIGRYTDDVIFFSYLLGRDLSDHGEQLRGRFVERFGPDAPRVQKADFSEARNNGMIPPDEQYKDWLRAFQKGDETGGSMNEQDFEAWKEVRARVDSIANAVFLIAGGALSISIGVLFGKDGATVSMAAKSLAAQSWWWLVAAVIAGAIVKFGLVLQAYVRFAHWEHQVGWHTWTTRINWTLGILGLIAFVAGMIALVRAAVTGLGV